MLTIQKIKTPGGKITECGENGGGECASVPPGAINTGENNEAIR